MRRLHCRRVSSRVTSVSGPPTVAIHNRSTIRCFRLQACRIDAPVHRFRFPSLAVGARSQILSEPARRLQYRRAMGVRIAALATAVIGLLAASAPALNAGSRLTLNVSPAIGMAPAFVVATITVERDTDNRAVEVAAESGSFFRSSSITLDGDRAPRTSQVTWRDMPGGEYRVIAVLYGTDGHRASVQRSVLITPSARDR
jgi:hypothetical protein